MLSIRSAVTGLLQGAFFIDAFRLNVWFAKQIGGERVCRSLNTEDQKEPANPRIEFKAVCLLILGLVLAVAAILVIPGFVVAGVFNSLNLSPEDREIQIRVWSWSFLIALLGRVLRERKRGRW